MAKETVIRDNHHFGTVGEFLQENIESNSNISIVSAYFTIYAYDKLREQLNEIKGMRFLFGEPTFIKSIDPQSPDRKTASLCNDKLNIKTDKQLQTKSIAKACYDWINEKAEIRSMVKPNFLHGKMYQIEKENGNKESIVGSSNFTVNGLGLGNQPNIELNIVIDSKREGEELKAWFDQIWNDDSGLVEDVKEDVLKYLESCYRENEPEFVYFKTLFHIFESFLSEQAKGGLLNENIGFFETEVWNKLYDFQKDGVKGAINRMLKHNGCIIADSVGLGKTFEALAIMKYFELLNYNILVVCPAKLSSNWTVYQAGQNHMLNPFNRDRFRYSVIYHTDLGRETGISKANGINLENFNWSAYDLVVIDESHNFKGNPRSRFDEEGQETYNRAKWLMEKVIKEGGRTKVLLLSATPVNNSLRDLRNQISFITEGIDDALYESCEIPDISQVLKNAQTHFSKWADSKTNPNKKTKELLDKLDSAFFKLLDELTIARSRKHIKSFYDIKAIGKFPRRLKPISIYSKIDIQDRFPTYDGLNKQILEYKLSVFNPSAYVKEDMKAKYEDLAGRKIRAFSQQSREYYLIGMMKVNFLKRLESSIESFEISLKKTIEKIEKLQNKIKEFQKTGISDISTENTNPDEEEMTEIDEQWQVGKKLKFELKDLEIETWLEDLEEDRKALIQLYNNACAVDPKRDAKLKDLKDLIKNKINKPINDANKKVVVFAAFSDTAQYLYENLRNWCLNDLGLNCAVVCGSDTKTTFGKNDFDNIIVNFSPKSKERSKMKSATQEGEIDILFATDCISEGQNLQDCDCIINYDIHWNPVRIIQRFGRIDRLGSTNKSIQLINFWPTKDLDLYIKLKDRVETRMALVDITATGDDNLLSSDELEDLAVKNLEYRTRQLKKMKDEVLDIEDAGETVSLTDFTLDDFRIELTGYIESNKQKLTDAPLGLYAVVPSPCGENKAIARRGNLFEPSNEIMRPGVIFCLRQKSAGKGSQKVNPLSPYFLVYIRDDGEVRYNYTHSKHILEIFRLLCINKKTAYDELCKIFNQETDNCTNVEKYSKLLKRAVAQITKTFNARNISRLAMSRDAILVPNKEQISKIDDFEIITWLVIK